MKRPLLFKYQVYDSVLIEPDKTSYQFFQPAEEQSEFVTNMTEAMALEWLMNNKSFRKMFIADFFDNPTTVKAFFGITLPFTNSNTIPGDIDMLLVEPTKPDKTIAFECKRVKAISGPGGMSKVNNVKKLVHGVKQANGYRSLGFHASYLAIILLDDGRALDTPNTMFRYGKTDSIECIYDIPWNEPLHEDVGIIFIKINQTTGKHINHTGGFGFCVDKLAVKLDQTIHMTEKVNVFLKENNK